MVKKYFVYVPIIIFVLLFNCGLNNYVVASEIGIVKILGSANESDSNAFQVALENAKKKAVGKAAAKVVVKNENGASLMKTLVADYQKYVVGKVKVVRKQKVNGRLLLSCDVPVDYEKLFAEVHTNVTKNQNANLNESVIFFVRFFGSGDKTKDINIADDIFGQYNSAFRVYGFQVEDIDVGDYNDPNLDYQNLKQKLLKQLTQVPSKAKYVIIADIQCNDKTQSEASAFAEVSVLSEAFSKNGNEFISLGQFNNKFSGTRPRLEHAMDFASQRAAINSSKYLADLTYQQWQSANHK